MSIYKCLNQQSYFNGDYSLVPIRHEHRNEIMKWRNDQVFHLRQNGILTKADQDIYFQEVINPQKDENYPQQILFSFLRDSICVAYGGLVHIDWVNKNAELSFLIDSQ